LTDESIRTTVLTGRIAPVCKEARKAARAARAGLRAQRKAMAMIESKGSWTKGTWTDERIAQLKSCFEAGLTCREIASEMGVSRNAVIGKISRLNLSRFKGGGGPERRVAPKPARPKIVTQHQILMAIRAEPEPSAEAAAIASLHRCSLMELGQEKCRWPISEPGAEDFGFCGDKPVQGLPYCAAHARLAYLVAARRSARR
jgi:GcrA cell cycle regulator